MHGNFIGNDWQCANNVQLYMTEEEMFSRSDDEKLIREVFGPGTVDKMMRETMSLCWVSLPQDRRNIDTLEAEMNRLLARAIKDWREDQSHTGL